MVSKSLSDQLRRLLCHEMDDEEYSHVKQQIRDGVGEIGQFYRRLNDSGSALNAETMLLGSTAGVETAPAMAGAARLSAMIRNPAELADKVKQSDPGSTLDAAVLSAIAAGKQPLDFVTAVTLAQHLDESVATLMGAQRSAQTYLRQESPEASAGASAVPATREIWSDAQLELEDFVGRDTAKRTIAAWQAGDAALQGFLDEYASTVDRYEELKVRLLAAISLTKNHQDADRYDDELVAAANPNDQARQLDARYLRGRSRWYLNQVSSAIPDLRAAYQLAIELRNPVRQAQASLYLSRLATKHVSDFAPNEAVRLAKEAEELAIRGGRPDIQLLAMRAQVIALRNQGSLDEACRIARGVIGQSPRWLDAGLDRIFRSFQIYYGVCLRNIGNEPAREEAEQIYSAMVTGNASAQEVGMASYLWADLHIDRLQQAWQNAARSSDAEQQHWIQVAQQHRSAAVDLCESGRQLLREVGDTAAERKAVQRLLTLRGQSIELPENEIDVLEDYSARNHAATAFLLGGLQLQDDGSVQRAGALSTDEMEGFLNTYFQGLVALGGGEQAGTVSLGSFLTAKTLLAIPWQVGNDLIVRVFATRGDGNQMAPVGLYSIDHACGLAVRRAIGELNRSPSNLLDVGVRSLYSLLQNSLVTADALTLKERSDLAKIESVIVLPPRHPEDWALPIEWLRTDSDVHSRGISLLEFSRDSVIFSGFGGTPLASLATGMDGQNARLLATDQQYDSDTILSRCERVFGSRVQQFDPESESSGSLDDRPVFVFAHDDAEQLVGQAIQTWNWAETKVAVLLFCSSGQHKFVRGPFVDGISFKIQQSMPPGGLVVGARLPVTLDEAIPLAQSIIDEPNASVPVAQRVTRYLKFIKRSGGSPFLSPWVVIG